MNYKIIENFIDKKTCFDLIKDADIFAKDDHVKVLNERLILPSSSLSFLKLINHSKSWKNLHEQLNSKEFLTILLKTLDIKKHSFEVTNFFFNYKPNKLTIAERPLDMRLNSNLFKKKTKLKLKNIISEINLTVKQYEKF